MLDYIKKWKEVILNCNFTNTYKMAWARAIIEICEETELNNEDIIINFDLISKKMMKFYWNQQIYFDLIHTSNPNNTPYIVQSVNKMINNYFFQNKSKQPINFIKAEHKIDKIEIQKNTKYISKILSKDVSWRFLNLSKNKYDLYKLDDKKTQVYLQNKDAKLLKQYAELLYPIINLKWSQILEKFNPSTPNIASKVSNSLSREGVKRKSLTKYKDYLDYLNDKNIRKCFYCIKAIEKNQVSIDHVIPWSYMYSDDLWNLVYCHKSENSSKSNIIVKPNIIERLDTRNIKLLKILERENIKDKEYHQLKLAIDNNYLQKFWTTFK